MGLVRRGSLYYQRSKRVGGKVTSEYVAGGAAALEAARYADECRAAHRLARRGVPEEQQFLDAVFATLAAFCNAVEREYESTLIAAGYHRHNRGEWRKKRV